jgi:LemA protein
VGPIPYNICRYMKGFKMEFLGNNLWLIVIIGVALIIAAIYNRLVALKQNRQNAFADIDVQLKQRLDLVPNLVETVKGYAAHETETFQKVTNARAAVTSTSGDGVERLAAERQLGNAMMNLFAVSENYPQLKADIHFQQLMNELSDIENKISSARRFFNNSTNEYNTAVQQFPANFIAGLFKFHTETFYEVDEIERELAHKAPDVSFSK